MQPKTLFSKWTQTASIVLMGGSLAWAIKLGVIILTNGRIIDSGAAALLMKVGLLCFIVGSTAIGSRLSRNRALLLRAIAIILSPVVVFGSFILFGLITSPLFENSSVWYAQQEAGIALATLIYLPVGYLLYRSYGRAAQ
jgi:hypothetical protein